MLAQNAHLLVVQDLQHLPQVERVQTVPLSLVIVLEQYQNQETM